MPSERAYSISTGPRDPCLCGCAVHAHAAKQRALVLGRIADGGGLAEMPAGVDPAKGILPFTPSLQTRWRLTPGVWNRFATLPNEAG